MPDYSKDFALDPSHVWLNAASEGPLPNVAAQALREAIVWKQSPHLLTIPKFQQVPLELKKSIAALIHVKSEDVILGNSATYGIHLLANGLSWKAGDEIILMQNDFPTDILPWLSLEQKGVVVRQLKPKGHMLTPQEVAAAINPRTKLICLSYIHTFSGYPLDVAGIGKICQEYGILYVINLSQAAGAFEVNLEKLPVDAVVCAGYKWLLGPYGTGFCWIKKEVRERLDYPQNYWISLMDEQSLSSEGPMSLKDDHSARRYDMFGTANFFNYVPWRSSIEYLLSIGLENIQAHNQALVNQFVDGLNKKCFHLISPEIKAERTNIAVFSDKDPARNQNLFNRLKDKGFHLALWKGKLRVSAHIYNTPQDIQRLLEALDA